MAADVSLLRLMSPDFLQLNDQSVADRGAGNYLGKTARAGPRLSFAFLSQRASTI